MHELSVVANLFEILAEKLEAQNGKRVVCVKLQVGLLSGVVPELLKTAFEIYKKDTFAEEAELDITEVACKVECQECGAVTIKEDYIFICDQCGSANMTILEGTDMILETMEIEI